MLHKTQPPGRRNADKICASFPAGVLIVVGDQDTSRGSTRDWNVKLHEMLKELQIKSDLCVVKDVRQFELAAEPRPQMYLTYRQAGFFPADDLVVKTDVNPASLAATVRKTVWEIDKDQPVSDIRTMDEILGESIARQRFSMLLLAIFAGVAMVLAGVGIYGVMSYSVAQRTNEIGIRLALGAQKRDVLLMVVKHGSKLILIGVAIGLAAAFALTRLIASLLFGVTAKDPLTFAAVAVLLAIVALLACYVPALRATKVDPMDALRCE